jgi:hypothetical protein
MGFDIFFVRCRSEVTRGGASAGMHESCWPWYS